jgi:signal transduction histidine kinase
MTFLRDRSIGFTISSAFAATLLLMAVLVGLTLREIEDTKRERKIVTEEVFPTIDLAVDVEYEASRLSAQLFVWIVSSLPEDRQTLVEEHAKLGNDVRTLGTRRFSGLEAGQIEALRRAATALWSAVAKGIEQKDTFGSVIADVYYRGNIPQLVTPTVEAAQQLEESKRVHVDQIRTRLKNRGDRLTLYLLIGFIGASLVCILVARGTIATVTQPARRLVVAARVLEHGEYDRAIDLGMRESGGDAESDNEIERLRRSFVRMARALQEREERLLEQARVLEASNSRLASLQSITDVGLSHLSLDELLGQLVERLVAATSARSGAIFLLDADNCLHAHAAHGITPESAQRLIQRQAGDWVSWLQSTPPLSVRKLTRAASVGSIPPGEADSQGALLALPLLTTGSALGLAYVESPRSDAFGDEALALMRVFAERVSRAIERARAFAALEDWNETLGRRVAEQQEKLIRSERLASIGLVGAGIAHELRNPLGIINNSVYFLRQRLRDADEKVARHTEIIEREVAHAARVIDSLVQFSQHSAPEAHPVELPLVYAATVSRLHLPESVRVSLDVADGLPYALADEQRLGQVLENLIRNAAQAMESRGEIRCMASGDEDTVLVQVQDTGPGIPPEHRERIFEPLFSTKSAGMGLGLALCRKMIEAWGGEISVDCPPAGGTVFSIRLRGANCSTPVRMGV